MSSGLEGIPWLYLLVVWLTPLKFDMNIFMVFCGVAVVFVILDIFKTMAKRREKKMNKPRRCRRCNSLLIENENDLCENCVQDEAWNACKNEIYDEANK